MTVEGKIRDARDVYRNHTADKNKQYTEILSNLNKHAPSTHVRRRFLIYGFALAASVMIILSGIIGLGLTSPAMAKTISNIPVIGQLMNLFQNPRFSSPGLQRASEHKFDILINKSVTSHGITLTIYKAYVEQDELAFSMSESVAKNMTSTPVIRDNDIQMVINGDRQTIKIDPYHIDGGMFQKIANNTYSAIVHFNTQNMTPYRPIPEQFNLAVQVNQIGNVHGNWHFIFPMSRQNTLSATKIFTPMVSGTLHNMTLTVQKISFAPSQTEIDYELKQPVTLPDPTTPRLVNISVHDQTGKVLSGAISSISEPVEQNGYYVFQFVGNYTTPQSIPTALTFMPDRGLLGLSISEDIGK